MSMLILATLNGLCAYIGVNTFNKYFDFKSDLDFLTHKYPLLAVTGRWRRHLFGLPDRAAVLLIGVPGVWLIYKLYTASESLALILFTGARGWFGMPMTLGAVWVFSGQITATAWVVAFIVTLLEAWK